MKGKHSWQSLELGTGLKSIVKLLANLGNNKETRELDWSGQEKKQEIRSERYPGFVLGRCKVFGFYFE